MQHSQGIATTTLEWHCCLRVQSHQTQTCLLQTHLFHSGLLLGVHCSIHSRALLPSHILEWSCDLYTTLTTQTCLLQTQVVHFGYIGGADDLQVVLQKKSLKCTFVQQRGKFTYPDEAMWPDPIDPDADALCEEPGPLPKPVLVTLTLDSTSTSTCD